MNIEPNAEYITVSQFTKLIKNNLERNYTNVLLRGEISNFTPSSTGNWFFSLKDKNAAIKAIVFRNFQKGILQTLNQSGLSSLENGKEIIIHGRISLYEARGEYSVIVDRVQLIGVGELKEKYEQLKNKLKEEGLFDLSTKKSLPKFPTHIGIVTSPTAAALQDILNVIKRRFSGMKITVFPASVQGDNAKNDIVQAINYANYHYLHNTDKKVDVLIISRGGGSIEDLWPFNEEIVAYAIYESPIPILTGIGHEVDTTIADFCADMRAPTPSAAAEIIVRESDELVNTITGMRLRLQNAFYNNFENLKFRFSQFNTERLSRLIENILEKYSQDVHFITEKLNNLFFNYFEKIKNSFKLSVQKLNNLSPLTTLSRGYGVVLDENKTVIKRISQVEIDQNLSVIIDDGQIGVKVKNKKAK